MNVWTGLSLLVVSIFILVDNRRFYKRQLSAMEAEHQSALRSERISFATEQHEAQRRIGVLEERLVEAEKAAVGPITIGMQSMEVTFLVHDFVIASSTPEVLADHLQSQLEHARFKLEEKARQELMVIFTEPVIESLDFLYGKAYRVVVGVFPKFQLAPDGEFVINGYRVMISFDEDGNPVEETLFSQIHFHRPR